jgi:LDH2 family malate/lactate/ureidoglycolate dehydrogenase
MRRAIVRFVSLLIAVPSLFVVQQVLAAEGSRTLSLDQRIEYQHRLEAVWHGHRIWPAGNTHAKPSLDQLLSEAALRARVEHGLAMSAALEHVWHAPITGAQLQAEIQRMVAGSKDPATLRELFAALDNDPFVIAECLARPQLAERLARSRYARDGRWHGALRGSIELELSRAGAAARAAFG